MTTVSFRSVTLCARTISSQTTALFPAACTDAWVACVNVSSACSNVFPCDADIRQQQFTSVQVNERLTKVFLRRSILRVTVRVDFVPARAEELRGEH